MALEFSRWHRMTEVGIWVDNKFPWTFLLQGCRHVPQPHALSSGYCREEDKVMWASTSSFLCLQSHKIQDGLQASPLKETKLTLVSLSLSKVNYSFDPSTSSFRKEEIALVSVLSIILPCGPQWIWSLWHGYFTAGCLLLRATAPTGSLAPHRPPVNGNDPRGRTARTAAQEPQHHVGTLLPGDSAHKAQPWHSQVPIPGSSNIPRVTPNMNHRGWTVHYLCEDQARRLQLQCNPPQHSQGQVLPQKYQEDVSL